MADPQNRRPIATRNSAWANRMARWLATSSVTPNQISQASILMAALVTVAFYWSVDVEGPLRVAALLAAAMFCQLRLVCNLLDGMVAVEGGKASSTGPFWNEFPDRIADVFILAGLGYAAGSMTLGWVAAALAVLTAYTRELGQTAGVGADFSGPMAKPHRMAAVTLAAVLSVFEPLWGIHGMLLNLMLWLIIAGTGVTVVRRVKNILAKLQV